MISLLDPFHFSLRFLTVGVIQTEICAHLSRVANTTCPLQILYLQNTSDYTVYNYDWEWIGNCQIFTQDLPCLFEDKVAHPWSNEKIKSQQRREFQIVVILSLLLWRQLPLCLTSKVLFLFGIQLLTSETCSCFSTNIIFTHGCQ